MPKDFTLKLPRMTSRAKITPAIGALNVAATPPAAPQATRLRTRSSDIFIIWPNAEPIVEPICTIGPSRPTEPPVPIDSEEAIDLTRATTGRILPPRRATASITSGTPWPLASRAKK